MGTVLLIILGLSLLRTRKNVRKAHEKDLQEAEKVVHHNYECRSLITNKPVSQLQQLYAINPEKFRICSCGIMYNEKILFSFSSLKEWFKFLSWKNWLEKQKEERKAWDKQAQENKLLEEMYEDLLSDIEKQKQEAQEIARRGAGGIAEVLDRISRDGA